MNELENLMGEMVKKLPEISNYMAGITERLDTIANIHNLDDIG